MKRGMPRPTPTPAPIALPSTTAGRSCVFTASGVGFVNDVVDWGVVVGTRVLTRLDSDVVMLAEVDVVEAVDVSLLRGRMVTYMA